MTRSTRRGRFLLVPCVLSLLAAASGPAEERPDDLIRRANERFRAGDRDAADALYQRAEERTADPGLVAFNRGAVLFGRGLAALRNGPPDEAAKHFAEADRHYARALGDAACPPDRAAKAWYNRGTCLLRLGGSWDTYRAAVACFEHALDGPAADEALRADARVNIERAKLLCIQERQKDENKNKSPNRDVPPQEQPRPEPERRFVPSDPEPGAGTEPKEPGPAAAPGQPASAAPKGAGPDRTAAGNSAAVAVLRDTDAVQDLTPGTARATLEATARRIKREQQSLLRGLYGPDRPGVRDW